MTSLRLLTDDQLKETYEKAQQFDLPCEFIQILLKELAVRQIYDLSTEKKKA